MEALMRVVDVEFRSSKEAVKGVLHFPSSSAKAAITTTAL
jgi:hypothetical protein